MTLEKADKATLRESLRSPHVFEFLGLAAKDVWEESDLEQGVIEDDGNMTATPLVVENPAGANAKA